jgi:flagellar basal body-associated protein FliL
MGILAVSVLVDAAAWYWLRARSAAVSSADKDQVVRLGTFEFNRVNPHDQRLYHGQFDVSIHLADELDAAHVRDVARQLRELQRTVTATLMRLRASDFSDPHLLRLKDRLQERLNDALGFEAIDNLLIDNLSVERLERVAPDVTSSPPESSAGGTD